MAKNTVISDDTGDVLSQVSVRTLDVQINFTMKDKPLCKDSFLLLYDINRTSVSDKFVDKTARMLTGKNPVPCFEGFGSKEEPETMICGWFTPQTPGVTGASRKKWQEYNLDLATCYISDDYKKVILPTDDRIMVSGLWSSEGEFQTEILTALAAGKKVILPLIERRTISDGPIGSTFCDEAPNPSPAELQNKFSYTVQSFCREVTRQCYQYVSRVTELDD